MAGFLPVNNSVFRPGKKTVKSSKSLVSCRFSTVWKTLWKMWITLCRAFPVRLLCQFTANGPFRRKVTKNMDFDKIRVFFDRSAGFRDLHHPETFVSSREISCSAAAMNTPCIPSGGAENWWLTGRAKHGTIQLVTSFGEPCACVAQLAEQLTRNEQVAGSNPATSSKK